MTQTATPDLRARAHQAVDSAFDVDAEGAAVLVEALQAYNAATARRRRLDPAARPDEAELTYLFRVEAFEARVRDGHTVAEAARIAGLSQSRVRHLISEGSWPASRSSSGAVRVPRFLFTPTGAELPGGRAVARAAGAAGWDIYSLASFLEAPQDFLGGSTPSQWLQSGADPAAVVSAIGTPG